MALIYKISCRNSKIKDCYIGSTEDLNKRCERHKSRCNNPNDDNHNLKVYTFIRANGGFSNYKIEPIHECNVEDRYIEEQRWFELLQPTLNSKYPKRSLKEYREKYKDYYKDYYKNYRENNKDYYKDYLKQYYENNKQTISEKDKVKIECECGSVVRKADISRHRKSTKHQKLINSKL